VTALSAEPLAAALWSAAGAVPGPEAPAATIFAHVLRAVLLLGTFAALYALVPQGPRGRWPVMAGAASATVLFLLARGAFIVSMERLWTNLSVVYGSLAAAALLMLWAWYVSAIVLLGASIASHTKVMVLEREDAETTAQRHVAQTNPA
jgi:uncharacterized BrkB/YihY/UPF0761 family membrane protein